MRRKLNPAFWALANLGSRVRYTPPIAEGLTTATLPEETSLTIPTRHGALRAVLVRPVAHGPCRRGAPVVMQLHGGGFLNRYPEQDRHIARYLAAELGAAIVLPDYSTAPKARYPVAEEEMYDVAGWVQASGETHGWDGTKLLLSGISAGSKLAINVCQQIHSDGGMRPLAVSLVVPVTDMSRTDRTSPIPRPAINPFVQRLVAWAYFPDAERRREALAAPTPCHQRSSRPASTTPWRQRARSWLVFSRTPVSRPSTGSTSEPTTASTPASPSNGWAGCSQRPPPSSARNSMPTKSDLDGDHLQQRADIALVLQRHSVHVGR
jgi:acetyl esterase